jgi:hypothetical protein
MDNLAKTHNNDVLPEFQKYLLEKKLVPEKNVPFCAHWISRFLNYARKNNFLGMEYDEIAVLKFIDSLKVDQHILDWQLRQANDSIRLYYFHYLKKTDERTAKAVAAETITGILR